MWYKRAQVGDRIICVKKMTTTESGYPVADLKVGNVYLIKEIFLYDWFTHGVGFDVGLRVDGAKFYAGVRLFRPVQKTTTKTGMAILNKIRKGVEQPVTIANSATVQPG